MPQRAREDVRNYPGDQVRDCYQEQVLCRVEGGML